MHHVTLVHGPVRHLSFYLLPLSKLFLCPSHFSIPFRHVGLASLVKSSDEWRLGNFLVLPLSRACHIYGLFLLRSENYQELGVIK